MKDKRMFSKVITESDAFLDMPLSTQALYFHLAMNCDDDGFMNSASKVQRMIGANKNDYDILVAKSFIIEFADGVVVIKHWLMHNYIRNDRYTPTVYTKEKESLFTKVNKAYTLDIMQSEQNATENAYHGIPVVDRAVYPDKIRLDKSKEDKTKDIDDFFERVWKLYPNKKGKGQVSTKAKKNAYKLGDEFIRCIERYVKYAKSLTYAYHYQNGSTFFNSGYVDYLDNNYVEDKQKQEQPTIYWGDGQ